jgi:hypothetical protein
VQYLTEYVREPEDEHLGRNMLLNKTAKVCKREKGLPMGSKTTHRDAAVQTGLEVWNPETITDV